MATFKYLLDSYLTEFKSKVLKIELDVVSFEDTIFYPTSGGQPNDLGNLVFGNDVYDVIDVKKQEEAILVKLNSSNFSFDIGDEVLMRIDFERRYRFMRMHSCAHLLSYVVFKNTGALITGNSISLDKSRIDFDLDLFDRDIFLKVEEEANILISEKIPILSYFLKRDDAFKIPSLFRLKSVLPPTIDILRIVEIDGLDKQACGGTHLKNLSEIGGVKIIKLENRGKNNRRLYFEVL